MKVTSVLSGVLIGLLLLGCGPVQKTPVQGLQPGAPKTPNEVYISYNDFKRFVNFHCDTPPQIPKTLTSSVPVDVKAEIEKLTSSYSVDKGNAALNLRKMGVYAVPAIPFLIWGLCDETPLTWSPYGVPSPPGPSSFPSTTPAKLAAETLAGIGLPTVEPLITALNSSQAPVRGRAAEALGRIKDVRAVVPLIAVLQNDRDYLVQAFVAEALGNIGDAGGVDGLTKALRDSADLVRWEAARRAR